MAKTMLARPVSFLWTGGQNIECSQKRLRTELLNKAFRSEILSVVRDKSFVVLATTSTLPMTAGTQGYPTVRA